MRQLDFLEKHETFGNTETKFLTGPDSIFTFTKSGYTQSIFKTLIILHKIEGKYFLFFPKNRTFIVTLGRPIII